MPRMEMQTKQNYYKCSVSHFLFHSMVDIVERSKHLYCMHNLFTAVTNKKREKKGPKKTIKYRSTVTVAADCRRHGIYVIRFAHRHVHFRSNETGEKRSKKKRSFLWVLGKFVHVQTKPDYGTQKTEPKRT